MGGDWALKIWMRKDFSVSIHGENKIVRAAPPVPLSFLERGPIQEEIQSLGITLERLSDVLD